MDLEAKINKLIQRRLSQLRRGDISSEEFEKATEAERNLERVNGQIVKIERLRRLQKGFYSISVQHRMIRPWVCTIPELFNFNENLRSAIEKTILEALGADALRSVLIILRDRFDVGRDELPYRLESLYSVLESDFQVYGAKTIGPEIARRFYDRLGLQFQVHDGFSLSDYVQAAKSKSAQF